ncbi:lysozyme inhibitor LprI family protein [Pararhodobacter marinus]|uniref:lysozyme inhibitor LprI family protein n=1 Tax=Pararhodobacter marinus TaxID=2184063 RepID=UPI00351553A5
MHTDFRRTIYVIPGANAAAECPMAETYEDLMEGLDARMRALEAEMDSAYESAQGLARTVDMLFNDTNAVETLERAQTAWRSYRQAQCHALVQTHALREAAGYVFLACRIALTRARIAQLRRPES